MNRTDFLFANPSFIGGLASVLDLGSSLVIYNESLSVDVADALALESDWRITGEDIKSAMARWVEENSIHG
ncbi:MAG: hypothetical protein JRG74_10720 [Deltaproteobacteria bacterium]|nr:hypothetical protein [Deltaproteobacteria bacterium]MBW1834539.1 hypothetical protein [Deltaproteobacteria bacterium]MBW2166534.1 hypothetical protein [Deltaproteobacteria bacterium]